MAAVKWRASCLDLSALKIRRSYDLPFFNMEIPIPGKTVFVLRQDPVVQG